MEHEYYCEYGRIALRPLLENDIESLRKLRNSQREYFFNSNLISQEDQIKWYHQYLTKSDDIMCVVELGSQPGVFVGAMALYNIDKKNKNAEFGRALIDKKLAPEKGIGRDAVVSMCMVGFDQLGLEKIICKTLKSNTRSIRVYENAGFSLLSDLEPHICLLEVTRDELNISKLKLNRV